MDPVSALGFAVNVLTVVHLGIETIKVGSELAKKGSIQKIDEFGLVAKDVGVVAESLKGGCSPDEKALTALATEAAAVGKELTNLVRRVNSGSRSRLDIVSKTIRAMKARGSMQELDQRLRRIRDELQFRVLVSIRSKIDAQSLQGDENVRALERQCLAMTGSVNHNLADLRDRMAILRTLALEREDRSQERHDDVIDRLQKIHVTVSTKTPKPALPEVDEGIQRRNENAILTSLWFPSKQDREDRIKPAHEKTFEWIFSAPTEKQRPWSDFAAFLRSSEDLYWVSGKAGCGKSTLMKFINQKDALKEGLLEWTGQKLIIMASYYFYYAGSAKQKSLLGLFRTILHDILQQDPSLIPLAFPQRLQAMAATASEPFGHGADFEFSYEELVRAFKNVVASSSHYFFLSVDGLDEYEHDRKLADLCDEVISLSKLPRVKFLASSRPLQEFEEAFGGYGKLRLHDLTREDISLYVNNSIRQHPNSDALDQVEMEGLVKELVDSSSGVFVWVRLVLKSVLQGLTNCDTITEMKSRLREYPTDLNELYHHILNKIPERYRRSASELLQLALCGHTGSPKPSSMMFSLAEPDEMDAALASQIKPFTPAEIVRRTKAIVPRIRSRCLGLLEVEEIGTSREYTRRFTLETDQVDFLHKSVVEFLSQKDVRRRLISWSRPGYEPDMNFLQASVRLLSGIDIASYSAFVVQTTPLPPSKKDYFYRGQLFRLEHLIRGTLFSFQTAQVPCNRPSPDPLHQICEVIDYFASFFPPGWDFLGARLQSINRFSFDLKTKPQPRQADVLGFAIECVFVRYVEFRIQKEGAKCLTSRNGPSALSIPYLFNSGWLPSGCHYHMIPMLLHQGCRFDEIIPDPTEVYTSFMDPHGYGSPSRMSIWERQLRNAHFYHDINAHGHFKTYPLERELHLICLFLSHGADPNLEIRNLNHRSCVIHKITGPLSPLDLVELMRDHVLGLKDVCRDKGFHNWQEKMEETISLIKSKGGVSARQVLELQNEESKAGMKQ